MTTAQTRPLSSASSQRAAFRREALRSLWGLSPHLGGRPLAPSGLHERMFGMLASVAKDLGSGGWGGHPHTAPGDWWEGSKLRVGSGGQCDREARKRDSRKLCAAGPSFCLKKRPTYQHTLGRTLLPSTETQGGKKWTITHLRSHRNTDVRHHLGQSARLGKKGEI